MSARRLRRARPLGALLAALAAMPSTAVASDDDALTVLRDAYPGVVQSMQQAATPPGVATANPRIRRTGDGRVVVSTVPFTAGGKPVDRTLVDGPGGLEPRNPLVPTELAEHAADGFTVGEGDDAVRVSLLGADAATSSAVLGDGVVHEDTHSETDSLLRAVVGGVESFELLHGADAPERFDYRVRTVVGDAPVELRREGDRIIGSRAGRDVLAIPTPYAFDAAGHVVPVTAQIEPGLLRLRVAHRAPGTAYPVLVDPEWVAAYDWWNPAQGNGGVTSTYLPEGSNRVYDAFATTATGGWGPGITIRPTRNRVYQPGEFGKAALFAPPGSRIRSVTFGDVTRFNNHEKQTARLALYGDGPAKVDDWFEITPKYQNSVTLTDPTATAATAQIWLFTAPCDYGNGDDTPANCPRLLPANSQSHVTVGSISVELVDPAPPVVSTTGSLPGLRDRWVATNDTIDVTLGASDNGSGVERMGLESEHTSGARADLIPDVAQQCNEDHSASGQETLLVCGEQAAPESRSFTLDSLLEGVTTFEPFAFDYAGNEARGGALDWSVGVDRSDPVVDPLTGSAFGTAGWGAPADGPLTIAGDAHDRVSGVKGVNLQLGRDAPDDVLSVDRDLCPTQNSFEEPCHRDRGWSVTVNGADLPEGEVTATAVATDYVGRRSAPVQRKLFVDRVPPRATASGALTDIDGDWTRSSADTPVVVKARDSGSGVARIELLLHDDAGQRVVADHQVCDPADLAAGERCPARIEETLEVDLGDVTSGIADLEVYAVDAAGNRTVQPDAWEAYVDHDPPSPVRRITATRTDDGDASVRWDDADDADSGVGGYEFRIVSSTTGAGAWTTTKLPHAQIANAPSEQFTIEVRPTDRAGNTGEPTTSDPVAERASSMTWTVENLEGYASTGKVGAIRVPGLRGKVMRFAKGSLAGLFAQYLVGKAIEEIKKDQAQSSAPPSCGTLRAASQRDGCYHPFNQANINVYAPFGRFAAEGKSLIAAGGTLSRYYVTQGRLARLQQTISDMRIRYANFARTGPAGAQSTRRIDLAYAEVAGRMDRFAVATAELRLQLQAKALQRGTVEAAKDAAKAIAAGGAIELGRQCATAIRGERIGPKNRNVLVYWAAPASKVNDPKTLYIGITNDWGRRCRAIRAVKALVEKLGVTLNMPALSRYHARTVEQALISHFGMQRDGGQLFNDRNEFNITKPDFCKHLLLGQQILKRTRYAPYSKADNPAYLGGRVCYQLVNWG